VDDDKIGIAKTNSAAEKLLNAWQRKARFVVEGPNGKFSTSWAAWDNGDSVYIAGRTIGGFIKISLHQNGGYRLAFTKEFHPKIKDRDPKFKSRDLAVWNKPMVDTKSAALVASICFPTNGLVSSRPPSALAKPYLIIQAPSMNRAANVGFFLSQGRPENLEKSFSQHGKAFCHWDFNDGTSISMVAWESAFDASALRMLDRPARPIPLTETGLLDSTGYDHNLTALAWNDPSPFGPLSMIEIGGVTLLGRK
jgi:hypothetical protein